MANKDLFKQAIAEAKSIREAAIANAKEALEETLTPHLKDMLAAKLQEMEDAQNEEEVVNEIEEEIEETVEEASKEEKAEEVVAEEEIEEAAKDEEAEDDSEESEDEAEEAGEGEEKEEEEVEVKDMEVDDLKALIRDIIAQEMGAGEEEAIEDVPGAEDMIPAEDGAEEEEINLEELLAELAEMDNKEEKVEETIEEETINEISPDMMTLLQSLAGTGAIVGGAAGLSAFMEKAVEGGFGPKVQKIAQSLQAVGGAAAKATQVGMKEDAMEEETINEISPDAIEMLQGLTGAVGVIGGSAGLAALMDKAESGEYGDKVKKLAQMLTSLGDAAGGAIRHNMGQREGAEDLNEALATIETLRTELSEVNLLNAKLLYVNKVFKSHNLNESQKVSVIAAFDKAETVKEVKLVFETVADNFGSTKKETVKESKLGMASKATGVTASKPEVIAEVSDAVRRMQKLAGIIK